MGSLVAMDNPFVGFADEPGVSYREAVGRVVRNDIAFTASLRASALTACSYRSTLFSGNPAPADDAEAVDGNAGMRQLFHRGIRFLMLAEDD